MTPSAERCYQFGPFLVDRLRRVLLRDGEPVSITAKVFDTLLLLVENHGKLLTKDELLKRLWPDRIVEEASLVQNIAVLRKTLGESPGEHQYIVTVPGRGYRFVAPVRAPDDGAQPLRPSPADSGRERRKLELALAALAGLVIGGALVLGLRSPEPAEIPHVKFSLNPGGEVLDAVIAPDGRHIAYVAGEDQFRLWIHPLDSEKPRSIDGSEGAQRPFWSPDSQLVAFSVGDEIRKVSVRGGPPVVLSPRPSGNFVGGTWSPGGDSIVFSVALRRLYQAPARGGKAVALEDPLKTEHPRRFWSPQFLPPTSRRVLMFVVREQNESWIVLRDLESGEETSLVRGGLAVYSPTGHILYQRSRAANGVWALPFSAKTLRPLGEPFSVAENGRFPSVSEDGTLVYIDSPEPGGWQLVWRDREGRKLATAGRPQELISLPALSPDGRRVAVVGLENGNQDVWIHDLDRPNKTRLTFDADADVRPTWAPGGDRVAFSSQRQGDWDIFTKRADASGGVTPLVADSLVGQITDWSADTVLIRKDDPQMGPDLWFLQQGGGGFEAKPFLRTPFAERAAKASPDGRFVAYVSDESGRNEVYVEEFPARGSKAQASANGGAQPRWSRDGKELYYVEEGTLIAVGVTTSPNLSLGAPLRLFVSVGLRSVPSHLPNYDVSADRQRFILPERLESEVPTVIRVVQNWFAEFQDRAPNSN